MKITQWLNKGLRMMAFSTKKAEIIPFPPIMTPTMPAFKRYLIDTLKMKGIPHKVDVNMDEHTVDIVLPNQHMMIFCSEQHEDPLEKSKIQNLRNYAKSIGYRLVVIHKDNFYRGLNATFFKLKQQKIFNHK
ncbi:MAG: hypothetical protein ACO1OC_10185 [Tuberibacillus sp.]